MKRIDNHIDNSMGWFDKLTTSWFDKLTTDEAHPTRFLWEWLDFRIDRGRGILYKTMFVTAML